MVDDCSVFLNAEDMPWMLQHDLNYYLMLDSELITAAQALTVNNLL